LVYRHIARTVKPGVVDVYTSFYFDPQLAEAIEAYRRGLKNHPLYELGKAIYDEISEASLLEKIDPEFRILKQIAIYTPDGAIKSFGDAVTAAFKSLLSSLIAAGATRLEMRPKAEVPRLPKIRLTPEQIAKITPELVKNFDKLSPSEKMMVLALSSDKRLLIDALRTALFKPSRELRNILKKHGVTAVYVVPTKTPIVIGNITKLSLEDIKKWAIVYVRGTPVVVPVVRIPELNTEVLVVPTLDIEAPQLEPENVDLESIVRQLEEQNIDVSTIQLPQLKTEIAEIPKIGTAQLAKIPTINGVPIGTPAGAPLPVPYTVVSATREGYQIEELRI